MTLSVPSIAVGPKSSMRHGVVVVVPVVAAPAGWNAFTTNVVATTGAMTAIAIAGRFNFMGISPSACPPMPR
jgi:hypothetical protein